MDKDFFDALVKLAEFRMDARKERRAHEWRVSLGLWVGLAAAIISLHGVAHIVLYPMLLIVFFGHAWLWVRWNWNRNERDARIAYSFYEDAVQSLKSGECAITTKPRLSLRGVEPWIGFLKDGPSLFEVSATAVLCVAVAVIAR